MSVRHIPIRGDDVLYQLLVLLDNIGQLYRDSHTEISEPAPSLSRHGALTGGFRVFLAIKISVTRQVRINYGLKINARETLHAGRSWTHFVCVFYPRVGSAKPGGGALVFQAGYHPRKRTFKTHPKHVFFRYENRP